MVGPGLVGVWLDRRWGTSLWTPAGFLLGMALATVMLVVIAQQLTPPAGGRPLPPDEDAADGNVADDEDAADENDLGHGRRAGRFRGDAQPGGADDTSPKL